MLQNDLKIIFNAKNVFHVEGRERNKKLWRMWQSLRARADYLGKKTAQIRYFTRPMSGMCETSELQQPFLLVDDAREREKAPQNFSNVPEP